VRVRVRVRAGWDGTGKKVGGLNVGSVLRSVWRVVGLLVRWCAVFVYVMDLGLGCIVGKMLVEVRWDLRGILGGGRTQDWGHVHYLS